MAIENQEESLEQQAFETFIKIKLTILDAFKEISGSTDTTILKKDNI
jgi:hypothetical protein